MMEWGIIKENDPYLYGEKVKAYMQKRSETAAWIYRVSESAGGIWGTMFKRQYSDIRKVSLTSELMRIDFSLN